MAGNMKLDLTDRVSLLKSLSPNAVGAEIGVFGGWFADRIMAHVKPRHLYLVDCWVVQPESAVGQRPSGVPQSIFDQEYQRTLSLFAGRSDVTIIRSFSVNAASRFVDKLDWVYIDANHLLVIEDILAWWTHVKPGGWITGHDYVNLTGEISVKDDIDELTKVHGIELFTTTGQGENECNAPSWAFQRPEYEIWETWNDHRAVN